MKKTLQLSLTNELPTSRAVFLVGKVARYSDRPDLAWEFAAANMKALLAKTDALGANSYPPSLFVFFSEESRADELKAYAKTTLPPTSAKEVAKAVDEVEFRAEFFNAFNHTEWNNISTTFTNGNFGAITSTHDPREIQLGLKLYF